MSDLYAILGVPKDASQADVRKAYREKAKALHPDKGGDPEAFKRLEEAHRILSDADARRFYNATGTIPNDATATNPNAGLYQIIGQCLAEAIEGMENPAASDLIASMRQSLRKGKQAVARRAEEAGQMLRRLEIIVVRIKSKSEENIVASLVRSQIEGVKAQIASCNAMVKEMGRADEWLRDYSYECDKALTTQQQGFQTSALGTVFPDGQANAIFHEAMRRFQQGGSR